MSKDFQEFRKFIVESQFFESLADDINKRISHLNRSSDLGTAIGVISGSISLNLLEKYHDWLQQSGEE